MHVNAGYAFGKIMITRMLEPSTSTGKLVTSTEMANTCSELMRKTLESFFWISV